MKNQTEEEQRLIAQLGKRLKRFRIQQGFTSYEHFANEHGFSRTQYGRYETGENMKFITLCRILKAMDISLEIFFSEGFEDL
jgi:transcriptional regulator with XRE-family HTH domain